MPSHVQRSLEELQLRVAADGSASGLTFETSSGAPLDPSNVRRRLRTLCDAAGIRAVVPHELRHTAASLLAADVVAAGHIADFLGHVGTRMTLKTYRHVLAPAVTAARTPMDRLIN